MGRMIELGDDALVVRYDGLSAAAVLKRELRIPYAAIGNIRVGTADLPGPFVQRVGTSTAPFGDTRRGTFRWRGRRFFDLNNRDRCVVLDLSGHDCVQVALGVDDPQRLADEIAARLGS